MLLALSVIKAINLEGPTLSMGYKVRIITCNFCLNGTETDNNRNIWKVPIYPIKNLLKNSHFDFKKFPEKQWKIFHFQNFPPRITIDE